MNTYEVFVQGGPSVKTSKFKIPRGMLEYTVGMGGKVVDEVGHLHHCRLFFCAKSIPLRANEMRD